MPLITIDTPQNVDFSEGRSWTTDDFRFAPKTKNFMRWLAWDTCARPFWVLMITFVPAIIEALITVKIWDINDIIRENAKAQAAPPPRGRRKRGKHASGVRVPGKEAPTRKWSRNGLAHLLTWTQPLETLGFALLLYSAADQFFFRWQSLIEAIAPCAGTTGSFMRSSGTRTWNMLFAGGPALMPDLDQNSAGWNTTAFQVGLPAGDYIAIFTARLTPVFPAVYPAGIQLFTPGIIGETITQSGLQELRTGMPTDFMIIAEFFVTGFGGTTVGWQTYGSTVPVGVLCERAQIVVSQNINSLAT